MSTLLGRNWSRFLPLFSKCKTRQDARQQKEKRIILTRLKFTPAVKEEPRAATTRWETEIIMAELSEARVESYVWCALAPWLSLLLRNPAFQDGAGVKPPAKKQKCYSSDEGATPLDTIAGLVARSMFSLGRRAFLPSCTMPSRTRPTHRKLAHRGG